MGRGHTLEKNGNKSPVIDQKPPQFVGKLYCPKPQNWGWLNLVAISQLFLSRAIHIIKK